MKKYVLPLLCALSLSSAAQAQNNEEKESYRMLVHQQASTKGFLVDRVEDVSFVKVTGEVRADVKVEEVALDHLIVTIQRSSACQAFRIAVMPKSIAGAYANYPDYMVEYVEQEGSSLLYEDFQSGRLSGIDLQSAADYSVVTVAYDVYGVACDICREDFTTPSAPLVGDPKVTSTIKEVTKDSFTLHCEPNADVAGYSCVAGEKGTMQESYDMYAAWFGFTCFGDMIKAWGYEETTAKDIAWNGMNPGTEYEIFVQPWDVNGTYATCDVVDVRTVGLGGDGEASVSIKVGDYKMMDWGGEQKPSQFLTFTPNDQASCYRYGVYLADGEDGYDANKAAIEDDLKQDPPQSNMAYWFFYETLTTDFQIDPNTNCVAIAAAKNAKGEWGKVTEVRFTTPNTAVKIAPTGSIQKRVVRQSPSVRANRIPVLKQPQTLQLR